MHRSSSLFAIIAALVSLPLAAQEGLSTDQQRFSYAVGVQIGQNVKNQPTEMDTKALLMGIEDTISGTGLKLTNEEMQQAVMTFQQAEQQRQVALGEENKAKGEQFLAENKKKDEVTETDSGLQYQVLIEGTGEQPKPNDTVVVHYRGSLLDGTVFDSSYERGQPVAIPLDGVIQAWQEALPMMKVGSKWKIYLPSDLGYGPNAAGPDIGPNSTLVFDIELLAINDQQQPQMQPAPQQR